MNGRPDVSYPIRARPPDTLPASSRAGGASLASWEAFRRVAPIRRRPAGRRPQRPGRLAAIRRRSRI